MLESTLRQTALAHLGLEAQTAQGSEGTPPQVTVAERAPRSYVNLRFDAGDDDLYADISEVLSVAPPVDPDDVAAKRGVAVLWLGPDECLIVLDDPRPEAGPEMVGRLEGAIGARHASAVDLSHNYGCIYLSGPKAAETLARGCPLDFHPSVFKTGSAAQSHLGKAAVILYRRAETAFAESDGFEIILRRSFADYAFRYLMDSGRQFGIAVVPDPLSEPVVEG